jgi:hypothetical protein
VDPVLMMVRHVVTQKSTQMVFAERDHIVQ